MAAEPREQLPVAPDPPVEPRSVGTVTAGIPVHKFYVAYETGPHVAAFQQVMAEPGIVRDAFVQCSYEHIDVVDAFARENPLVEDILVYVRHCGRIRVNASLARKYPGEKRPVGPGDAYADPRLLYAVSFLDLPG